MTDFSSSLSSAVTHTVQGYFTNAFRLTTDSLLIYEWITNESPWTTECVPSLSLILRPTASQLVCLGIKHPSRAYDKIFITVRQSRICWCGALSLTRGWVRRLQLLLGLASAVILGSESRGTCDHVVTKFFKAEIEELFPRQWIEAIASVARQRLGEPYRDNEITQLFD
jgi:hypothetical protein